MSLRPKENRFRHFGHVLVTDPTVEPVSLYDLKEHLNIENPDDDNVLTEFITMAREEIEDISSIAMINQTWKLTLDRWPTTNEPWWDGVREGAISELHGPDWMGWLELPRWPLSSVTTVKTYDNSNTETSHTVGNYFYVDTTSYPGRLALQSGATWPTALRPTNAVEVTYVAGYGSTSAAVPGPLKRAVRQMASHLYTHRGDGCDPQDAYAKSGAAYIIGRYKVHRL